MVLDQKSLHILIDVYLDYHLMTQELLNIKEETQAAENFAEVQKRLHESRAEEQAETAETANEGFRNAEKVLKRLESEKRGRLEIGDPCQALKF